MRNPLPCVSRLECILKLLVVSLGLLCLLSVPGAEAAAAAPACPTYEALTALAARPALVRLAIKGNCPAPAQLTARVTRASGEALGVALLPPDRDGGFSVDLGRWLGSRDRGGVYRIAWQSTTTTPAQTVLEQLHTIACPPPPAPATRFSAADSRLTVELPAGDRCQGETVATLTLADADGRAPAKPLSQRLSSVVGGRLLFDLRSIEPRARRSATLLLTNATGETRKIPLQLGEACAGGFKVTAQIDGDTLKGNVAAEDCHFPVRARVSVTTERGSELVGEEATIRSAAFSLALPRSPRAADPYRVSAEFVSASSAEAALTFAGTARCPPPTVLEPSLERTGEGDDATIKASYSSTLACHGKSKLTLQLRDPQNTVVFNRSIEASPGPTPVALRWPAKLAPGVAYELQASIDYGPDRSLTTSGRRRLTSECPAPGIVDLGFSQPDGSALGAHLRLAACNIPVQVKLMIRDSSGHAVGAFERVIRQFNDVPLQPLALGSIANLATGRYTASLVVSDTRGRATTREASIQRDVDPPPARFLVDGQPVPAERAPALTDLTQLTIQFDDPSGLLPPVKPMAEEPPPIDSPTPRVRVREATAGNAPDVRLVLDYDVAPAAAASLAIGVLLKSTDGRLWLVPAARRYLAFDPEFLREVPVVREMGGLSALARSASLAPGTYQVAGVVLERDGTHFLVRAKHELTVSPIAHRRPLAALRQAVKQIPVRLVFDDAGRASVAADAPVPDGTYSLQLETYDRFGNSSGTTVQQLLVGRAPQSATTATPTSQQGATRPTPPTAPGAATPRPSAPSSTLVLSTLGGELVLPKPLSLDVRLQTPDAQPPPAAHGAITVAGVLVTARPPLAGPSIAAQSSMAADGRIHVTLPPLRPGPYELRLTVRARGASQPSTRPEPRDSSFATSFTVLDGRPIRASVLALRTRGRAPLTGHLSLEYDDPAARADLARLTWERSADGERYEAVASDETGVDYSIESPGLRFYRARLVNRHTGVESITEPVRLSAVADERLSVEGPDRTFRGYPIKLKAAGIPAARVRWRVTSPGAERAAEHSGDTLTIDATSTGTFYVEAVALDATGAADSPASPRVFRAIEVLWPNLAPSVIDGPAQLEPGRPTMFTVTHPTLFRGRGNPAIQRKGEWELPDGKRVADQEFTELTLDAAKTPPEGVTLQYHAWINGAREETLTTTTHRVHAYEYRWPRWTLDTQTVSAKTPSIYRLAVRPATWQGWLGIPDATLQTNWVIPPDVRVLHRTDRELIVEVNRSEPFDVAARIIDDRGHAAELSATNVSPFRRTQLAIETVIIPQRALHTAPLKVTVSAKPVLLPAGRRLERVAFYLNGAQMGATDGSPLAMELPTAGRYHIRAIASIGTDIVAENSAIFEVADNAPAVCRIDIVGNFALNGVAKATCSDPDGHMVDYRWYRNGELFDTSGPRVKLSAAQLQGLNELSLVATDNAGKESSARIEPPGQS